jgi:hypothetical protein
MKRVRRILRKAIAAMPLLLLLTVPVIWVRSYFATDAVAWSKNAGRSQCDFWVLCPKGHIAFHLVLGDTFSDEQGIGYHAFSVYSVAQLGTGAYWKFAFIGFAVHHYPINGNWNVMVFVPCWMVLVAASIPSVLHMGRRFFTNPAQNATCCVACGYDLRATPNRCPECGLIPAVKNRLEPHRAGGITCP